MFDPVWYLCSFSSVSCFILKVLFFPLSCCDLLFLLCNYLHVLHLCPVMPHTLMCPNISTLQIQHTFNSVHFFFFFSLVFSSSFPGFWTLDCVQNSDCCWFLSGYCVFTHEWLVISKYHWAIFHHVSVVWIWAQTRLWCLLMTVAQSCNSACF